MGTLPVILTFIVGATAAWIGWQQMQIARVKLHYDLYDRRFRVFEAARALLIDTFEHGKPSNDELSKYWQNVADAVFLLDKSMSDYLTGMGMRAYGMQINDTMLSSATDEKERQRLAEKARTEMQWVSDEFNVLVSKFEPYLRHPGMRTYPETFDKLWARARLSRKR